MTRKKNIGIIILILIALSICTYYFWPKDFFSSEKIIIKKTVTIVWIGPLTGNASSLGIDSLNGIKLALDEYNKNKTELTPNINLVVADDQYDANVSKRQYENIVKKYHPLSIFLITYSAIPLLAQQALQDKILIINSLDNDDQIANLNKNIFLIAKKTEDLAAVIANALIDQNRKRALIIYYADDEFMPTIANTIKAIFQDSGGGAILVPYKKTDTNFKQALDLGKRDNVDAYVLLGYAGLGSVIKQATGMGIKGPFYGLNIFADANFQMNAGGPPENAQFADFTYLDGNVELAKDFLDKYQKYFNKYPNSEWTALQAYDAANILFDAIKKASLDVDTDFFDAVRNHLYNTTDYEGVSGKITIQLNGSARGIYPNLYVIKNGQRVKVKNP